MGPGIAVAVTISLNLQHVLLMRRVVLMRQKLRAEIGNLNLGMIERYCIAG